MSAGNAFALSFGGIKVMDLVYCPFGKTCASCDMRSCYTLTDEAGRKFPLRRYVCSSCRFELYNCAGLCTERVPCGRLSDLSLYDGSELSDPGDDREYLKKKFGGITHGHWNSPVL